MPLRKDALCAAAEWILAVESWARSIPGLVATTGKADVLPGAGNVIPGEVRLSLDLRHASDEIRVASFEALLAQAGEIASRRGLSFHYQLQLNQAAVPMNPELARCAENAVSAIGIPPHRLISGAGHDAMILAPRLPSAMIFLRSPGGVSHHPTESVLLEDVEAALRAGLQFLEELPQCSFLS
jgi:allantoate deiminase